MASAARRLGAGQELRDFHFDIMYILAVQLFTSPWTVVLLSHAVAILNGLRSFEVVYSFTSFLILSLSLSETPSRDTTPPLLLLASKLNWHIRDINSGFVALIPKTSASRQKVMFPFFLFAFSSPPLILITPLDTIGQGFGVWIGVM